MYKQIITIISLLLLFDTYSYSQYFTIERPINFQLNAGSEFIMKHRPDITDSAYQVQFRSQSMCTKCSETLGHGYKGEHGPFMTLTDSCGFKSYAKVIPLFAATNSLVNTRLKVNPYTGDSANTQMFKSCIAYPPLILNQFNETLILNTPIKDTYLLLRDIWYDTIIYLPEKCGKWQVIQGWGITANDRVLLGVNQSAAFSYATNRDTSILPYRSTSTRGIAQINTFVSNSNPYFLSHPTAVFYRNVPAVYKQNAIDPDGDSLVFKSIHLVTYDTVYGLKPYS